MTAMKLSARLLATHRTDHDAGAVMREAAAALDAAEKALVQVKARVSPKMEETHKIMDATLALLRG